MTCIYALDEYLIKAKQYWKEIEGMEIPEDLIEKVDAMEKDIMRWMMTRKLLQKELLDNYGITVMNGWEEA